MEIRTVAIGKIKILEEVQARESLNNEAVDDYAEKMHAGVVFPRPVVFDILGELTLVDGRHRIEAKLKLNINTVEVEVHQGSLRDAILYAARANSEHGVRRTDADKRKAVTNLLRDEEWQGWSDGKIAEICSVSQPFVSKVRREMIQNGSEFPEERVGRDNKTRKKKPKTQGGAPEPVVPQVEKPAQIDLAAEQEEATEPPTPFIIGEVERLRSRIIELQGLLKERDARIAELESENARLVQELTNLREKAA